MKLFWYSTYTLIHLPLRSWETLLTESSVFSLNKIPTPAWWFPPLEKKHFLSSFLLNLLMSSSLCMCVSCKSMISKLRHFNHSMIFWSFLLSLSPWTLRDMMFSPIAQCWGGTPTLKLGLLCLTVEGLTRFSSFPLFGTISFESAIRGLPLSCEPFS